MTPPNMFPPHRDGDGAHRYDPAPDMITSTFPDGVPAPKRTIWPWALLAAGLLILLVLCVGAIGSQIGGGGDAVQRRGGAGQLAPVVSNTPDAPKGPGPGRSVTVKDLTIGFKITEKQCFGSAGCNVVGHVTLAITDPDLFELRTFDVTYELRGVTDGPLVGSVTLDHGQYSADTEVTGTNRKSDKITAVVVDVEERL